VGCIFPVAGVPLTVFVAEDPDRAWAEIGEYLLLDADGKVVDVNRRPKSLMETFRNVHLNGADLDPKTGYVKQL